MKIKKKCTSIIYMLEGNFFFFFSVFLVNRENLFLWLRKGKCVNESKSNIFYKEK